MHADPLSDMLTRIRNAIMSWKKTVSVPYSKFKESVLAVVKKNGFISSYKTVNNEKFKSIEIKFSDEKKISSLKRISKPWCRKFKKWWELTSVLRWYWINVISTSEWVMAWYEAYKKKIWGELLCEIY